MTEEQLKEWSWDKFNSCYPVEYNNKMFMIYDTNYIRAKKLANILNKDVEYPTEIKGVCLFEQDFKHNYLWCDTDEIWLFLIINYNSHYGKIEKLIRGWLEEYDKFKNFSPWNYKLQSILLNIKNKK